MTIHPLEENDIYAKRMDKDIASLKELLSDQVDEDILDCVYKIAL
jgi:hypothetical protein